MIKSLFQVTLLASTFTVAAHTLAPAQVDPAALREQLQQAIARGDVAGALALYADDAVVDGQGVCTAAPCVGKAAIQKDLERRVAAQNHATTIRNYVSSNVLTARTELRNDFIKKAGAERIIMWLIYEVKGDKIASELGPIYERMDPQTARFLAWRRAQQRSP